MIGHAPGAARAAAAAAAASGDARRGGADRARQQSRPASPITRQAARRRLRRRRRAGRAACRPCRASLSGTYVNRARRPTDGVSADTGTPDHDRAQRADPDLPGRAARGADPPGAGARGPGARAGRRHRARGRSPTRAAFADYEAAQKAIQSQTVAVQANELALEGARAEQSVGTRTVLDVLNAEQELLNSQVALVTRQARRLCRRLPAAQRDGPGRGATISGSTAVRSTIRSAITAASPATGTTGRATRATTRSRPAPSARRSCRPIRWSRPPLVPGRSDRRRPSTPGVTPPPQ